MWYPRSQTQTQQVIWGNNVNIPASGSGLLMNQQACRSAAPGAVEAWVRIRVAPGSAGRTWRVRVYCQESNTPGDPATVLTYEKPIGMAEPLGGEQWIPLRSMPIPAFVSVFAEVDSSGAVTVRADVFARVE